MQIQLLNLSSVLLFWGAAIMVGGVVGMITFISSSAVEGRRGLAMMKGGIALLALSLVVGLPGMSINANTIKGQNTRAFSTAIQQRYGLHLNATQLDLLIAGDPRDGDGTDGERYGSVALQQHGSTVEVSLYYLNGRWELGTVGTGQVHELSTNSTPSV